MPTYKAPLDDIRFILNEVIDAGSLTQLPGYYRSEKKWDLIVVSNGQLVTAMEFKSQVGRKLTRG